MTAACLCLLLTAAEPRLNLAPLATPSTSYVSGHETLGAVNNGYTPRNSNDKSHGAYGNWPRTGSQWVQLEWSQAVSTNGVEVYWFDDQQGVRLPKACRLNWWDGAAWQPVPGGDGLGREKNRFNPLAFAALKTTRLRLEMDGDGTFSTGLLQWRVWDDGQTPPFPPRVDAGPDRVVLAGGQTWLRPRVSVVGQPEAVTTRWRLASGPAAVEFADEQRADTTVRLRAPGDYELELTAACRGLSASDRLRVRVQALPPTTRLVEAPLRRFSLSSPLWRARTKAVITRWLPHVVARLNQPKLPEGGIDNFVEAGRKLAGQPHGKHVGPPWANAYVLNTVESICAALLVDPQGDAEIVAAQTALRATLDDWLPKILAAQEPDGWLHTLYTINGGPRWRNKADHQGYIAGYLIEAALAHHALTEGRDTRLIDAAKRLADCWCNQIGPAPKQTWWDGHQEMKQALVRLAEWAEAHDGAGRGAKYLALARFLLESRDQGSSYDQSHVPVVAQYEAVGHAVRAMYLYNGLTNIAMHTGDPAQWSAALSLWDNFVHRKYYVTGGAGSGETPEGFGADFSLPLNAYCESCADVGVLLWQSSLQRAFADARYADLGEETLYNAVLGSLDLSGDNFTYTNALDSSARRYAWHGCPCCVGNIPRPLLMLPRFVYTRGPDAVYVNHYLGGTMDAGDGLTVVQTTDYPWHGQVELTLQPAAPRRFALHLRIPRRDVSQLYRPTPAAGGLRSLAVNGERQAVVERDGYAVLEREWRRGDRVTLEVPLVVQRVHADPRVAATRDRVALRYGPLVYNVESVDQDINATLAPDSPLTPEWRGDLLGGVLVVKGQWSNGQPLLAIPNWARLNRGGRSLVWLRER